MGMIWISSLYLRVLLHTFFSFFFYTHCILWLSSCCLQWCDNIGAFDAQLSCCFHFLILQYKTFNIIYNTYYMLLLVFQGFIAKITPNWSWTLDTYQMIVIRLKTDWTLQFVLKHKQQWNIISKYHSYYHSNVYPWYLWLSIVKCYLLIHPALTLQKMVSTEVTIYSFRYHWLYLYTFLFVIPQHNSKRMLCFYILHLCLSNCTKRMQNL